MEGRNRFDMSPDDMAEVLAVDRATFHRHRSGFVFGIRRCWQGNLFLQKIWDYFSTAGQLDTE
jgi:hypothetical protein